MTAPATAPTMAAQTVIETSRAVSISMNAPHTPVARWGPDYILVAGIIGNGHGFVIWWAGPDLNRRPLPCKGNVQARPYVF